MTTQARALKGALRAMGITNSSGRLSVTTEKDKGGCFGDAVAHVRAMTAEETAQLTERLPYVRVQTLADFDFSIVRY